MAEERRKQPRFSITGPIVVNSGVDEVIEGKLVDVSLLGFRFYSDELLQLGEKISATVQFPNGNTYPVEGVIRHATEQLPCCYGVAFTEDTMVRLVKEAFGTGGSGNA